MKLIRRSWSQSGRWLASGSDDTNVNIHSYQPEDLDASFKLASSVATGHSRNIFSAKFMPQSNDQTLVTCAGDGEVRVLNIERAGRSNITTEEAVVQPQRWNLALAGQRLVSDYHTVDRIFRSHSDLVKRIITESSPFLFLTCSEDGDVRQWDLRQPSSFYPAANAQNRLGLSRLIAIDDGDVPPPLISYSRFKMDLKTISCSTSQPHYIALGGAHPHCLLHDRRMLGRDRWRERGVPIASSRQGESTDRGMDQATRCVRRFAPRGAQQMSPARDGHITGCKISDANPNEMVVSWSSGLVYSFDLVRSPHVEADREGGADTLRAGSGVGRARESRVRKRKREKSIPDVLGEGRSRSTSGRSEGEPTRRGDLPLRANGHNGPVRGPEVGTREPSDPATVLPPTFPTETEPRALSIARAVRRIRRELVDLASRRWPVDGPDSTPIRSDDGPCFTSALGSAAAYLPVIEESIRTWSYPLNPTRDGVRSEQRMRRDREATYRFVQAAGTLSRILGGKLQTAGASESPATLAYFHRIESAPNEDRPLDSATLFGYDFLKAILAWLDGGRDGLLQAFKRSPIDRRDSPRFPIPTDAGLEALEEILIPYLQALAGDGSISCVEPSRFERDESRVLFPNERDAVTAFGHYLDMSTQESSGSDGAEPNGSGQPSASAVLPNRRALIRFWAFQVGRGLLMKVGQHPSSLDIVQAFSGLDDTINGVNQSLDDIESMLEVEMMNSPSQPNGGLGEEDEIRDEASSDDNTAPEVEGRMPVDLSDEDEDEEEEEEDDDDDESDDNDNDNDNEQGLFMLRSYYRDKRRHRVEAHVPCDSHTMAYSGHCNVDTDKDVDFFGKHDEYVVSGSDGGHVFIWDKKTGQIMNILHGDEDVVNVVQGVCAHQS